MPSIGADDQSSAPANAVLANAPRRASDRRPLPPSRPTWHQVCQDRGVGTLVDDGVRPPAGSAAPCVVGGGRCGSAALIFVCALQVNQPHRRERAGGDHPTLLTQLTTTRLQQHARLGASTLPQDGSARQEHSGHPTTMNQMLYERCAKPRRRRIRPSARPSTAGSAPEYPVPANTQMTVS